MEEESQRLRAALKSVKDSYDFFVEGGVKTAKNHDGYAKKLISFIEAHPNATSSDIIKYETEELLGIKPIS